jgi:hypothetical protein
MYFAFKQAHPAVSLSADDAGLVGSTSLSLNFRNGARQPAFPCFRRFAAQAVRSNETFGKNG